MTMDYIGILCVLMRICVSFVRSVSCMPCYILLCGSKNKALMYKCHFECEFVFSVVCKSY